MPRGSNPNSRKNLRPNKRGPAKATCEIRSLSQKLLSDPDYLNALKWRLQHGEAGAVEPLLYSYAYGKPREVISIEGPPIPLVVDLLKHGTRG